jgi:hypothetical protein
MSSKNLAKQNAVVNILRSSVKLVFTFLARLKISEEVQHRVHNKPI